MGFLSLGIMLGSWWAYYELGWGGWWFWDPVENASFMPWLMGAALVHSLAVTEKRGLPFVDGVARHLCVLFVAAWHVSRRSGVLTSVHAFAADPERGCSYYFSGLGCRWFTPALCLARACGGQPRGLFGCVSESLLMANNLVFTVATVVVLLGTLFPLVMDAFSLGKYSLGLPISMLCCAFDGAGHAVHDRWSIVTMAR
ncbi:MAG: hypothetical protein CM15mP74_10260 [Halieaceae bacterium]|nr:MAG: hypothetical protein CM15mP74_10260 [Halieaceae bacterium]